MNHPPVNLPDTVRLERGIGNLPCLTVTSPLATATVYHHGAHVALFQPHGERPVLFMSQQSRSEPGKPIRGGVPVIYPWFGPHPADPTAPAHGTARLTEWSLISATQSPDGTVALLFALPPFLQYRIAIGRQLDLTLEVHNPDPNPLRFEEALHTYFAVSNIHQCSVTGLESAAYDSSVEGVIQKPQGPDPIRFTGETDRLYLNTRATCVLHDPGWQRRVVVEKSGSDSTVVWNPWITKSKAMPDFGDDEWPGMLCIETVNARKNAVTIAPGQRHAMRATVHVEPFSGGTA